MQPFSFFLLFAVGRGDFGSGSGFKFNCAARVGSGQTISGTGRVRASVLSPCRPLIFIVRSNFYIYYVYIKTHTVSILTIFTCIYLYSYNLYYK